jgi:hypothetical protein
VDRQAFCSWTFHTPRATYDKDGLCAEKDSTPFTISEDCDQMTMSTREMSGDDLILIGYGISWWYVRGLHTP